MAVLHHLLGLFPSIFAITHCNFNFKFVLLIELDLVTNIIRIPELVLPFFSTAAAAGAAPTAAAGAAPPVGIDDSFSRPADKGHGVKWGKTFRYALVWEGASVQSVTSRSFRRKMVLFMYHHFDLV